MRVRSLGALLLTAGIAASLSGTPAARAVVIGADAGATPAALGVLAFGPGNVLFAADPQGAAIYAFDLGTAAGEPGAADVPDLDKKLAAVLGTDAAQVAITDLAVHPTTRNVYLAAMRGTGAAAAPALVRLDGAGRLDVVALGGLKYTSVALPNAPVANPQARRDPRAASITDMAFDNGQLIVAGLSNEEFASKLRAVKYPFSQVDPGTSVEIFHGNHGPWKRAPRSTRSCRTPSAGQADRRRLSLHAAGHVPDGQPDAAPGAKVRGTTIASSAAAIVRST